MTLADPDGTLPTVGRFLTAALLVAVSAASALAGPAVQWVSYTSPDGRWGVDYPATWSVTRSRDGAAVAFLAPPVQVGPTRFTPSLVVSSSRVDPGVPEDQVVRISGEAFERAVPGSRLLGRELVRSRDGRSVTVLYYYLPSSGRMPGLYVVLGVAPRTERLYTVIGTTSTGLAEHRTQAAQFRAVILSLRAR